MDSAYCKSDNMKKLNRNLFWYAPLIAFGVQLILLIISDYLYVVELEQEYGDMVAWSPGVILSVAWTYALIALPVSYLLLLTMRKFEKRFKLLLWLPQLCFFALTVLFLALIPGEGGETVWDTVAMVAYFELPYLVVMSGLLMIIRK